MKTEAETSDRRMAIKESIVTIPDYPKKGVLFRDITGLLADVSAFKTAIELIVERYKRKCVDKVVGIDARGFIFAAPVALALNAGFIPARKARKLPRKVFSEEYSLEYGSSALEIHEDAIAKGENVLIVDDLLAGGIVKDAAFIIALPQLGGENKLKNAGIDCFPLVSFDGE